jgi:tRNA(Ile)-lysidine synthetase-like protein
MEIEILPGKYVVAVSGGVDSMVLLDMLRRRADLELVVAHFEHGVRPDSNSDRLLVEKTARDHGLPFVWKEGRLGAQISEDRARRARYDFLREVRQSTGAQAIVTAHHEDDVIETAVLNLLRGTNRRGMTALQSTVDIVRPLLKVRKQDILAYARGRDLRWHEDSTNADMRYLRNYVRRHIVPALGEQGRRCLLDSIETLRSLNAAADHELTDYLRAHLSEGRLRRTSFITLPHAVSREVLAAWLRSHGILGYDRKTLERLVVAAKTYHPGRVADVQQGWQLEVERDFLALSGSDR